MKSIWSEVFPPEYDYCDSDITSVVDTSKVDGRFELEFEVIPYDKDDVMLPKFKRRLVTLGSYTFGLSHFDSAAFLGYSIKQVLIYPDIIRIDVLTTGHLFRLECDRYEVQDVV